MFPPVPANHDLQEPTRGLARQPAQDGKTDAGWAATVPGIAAGRVLRDGLDGTAIDLAHLPRHRPGLAMSADEDILIQAAAILARGGNAAQAKFAAAARAFPAAYPQGVATSLETTLEMLGIAPATSAVKEAALREVKLELADSVVAQMSQLIRTAKHARKHLPVAARAAAVHIIQAYDSWLRDREGLEMDNNDVDALTMEEYLMLYGARPDYLPPVMMDEWSLDRAEDARATMSECAGAYPPDAFPIEVFGWDEVMDNPTPMSDPHAWVTSWTEWGLDRTKPEGVTPRPMPVNPHATLPASPGAGGSLFVVGPTPQVGVIDAAHPPGTIDPNGGVVSFPGAGSSATQVRREQRRRQKDKARALLACPPPPSQLLGAVPLSCFSEPATLEPPTGDTMLTCLDAMGHVWPSGRGLPGFSTASLRPGGHYLHLTALGVEPAKPTSFAYTSMPVVAPALNRFIQKMVDSGVGLAMGPETALGILSSDSSPMLFATAIAPGVELRKQVLIAARLTQVSIREFQSVAGFTIQATGLDVVLVSNRQLRAVCAGVSGFGQWLRDHGPVTAAIREVISLYERWGGAIARAGGVSAYALAVITLKEAIWLSGATWSLGSYADAGMQRPAAVLPTIPSQALPESERLIPATFLRLAHYLSTPTDSCLYCGDSPSAVGRSRLLNPFGPGGDDVLRTVTGPAAATFLAKLPAAMCCMEANCQDGPAHTTLPRATPSAGLASTRVGAQRSVCRDSLDHVIGPLTVMTLRTAAGHVAVLRVGGAQGMAIVKVGASTPALAVEEAVSLGFYWLHALFEGSAGSARFSKATGLAYKPRLAVAWAAGLARAVTPSDRRWATDGGGGRTRLSVVEEVGTGRVARVADLAALVADSAMPVFLGRSRVPGEGTTVTMCPANAHQAGLEAIDTLPAVAIAHLAAADPTSQVRWKVWAGMMRAVTDAYGDTKPASVASLASYEIPGSWSSSDEDDCSA